MIKQFCILLILLLSIYFIKSHLMVGNNIDTISHPAITTRTEIMSLKKNRIIEKMKTNILYDVVKYLSISETFELGLLSKSLFTKMFEEVKIAEGIYRITTVCSINIPENLFPHVAIIFSS